MIDTSEDNLFKSTIRSRSTIPALSSFLGSYALDGEKLDMVVKLTTEGGGELVSCTSIGLLNSFR